MEKMEMNTHEKLRLLLIRCGHKLGSRHGGGHTQGRILKILYYQGPMTQKNLQDKLDIQPGSMSEIAAKLEGKGLILRDRDASDKRKILLTLTDDGRTDVENFQKHPTGQLDVSFDVLSAGDQQMLINLLEKLIGSWSETDGSGV